LIVWKDAPSLLAQIDPWLRVEGAKNVWALPRRIPGRADSPLVVHLLNRNYDFGADKMQPQADLVLHLRPPLVGAKVPLRCSLLSPDGATAQLAVEQEADGVRVKVPELKLWSLVRVD
jgi:hypothetical protein